jgi:predicted transcriptional regulator
MQRREGRNRGRLEILHDFLEAARREPKKTRIIGLANLNPASFEKYLRYCLELDLMRVTPGGYRLTPRADVAQLAIRRFMEKSQELDGAFRDLQRTFGTLGLSSAGDRGGSRGLGAPTWMEVILASGPGARSPYDRSGGQRDLPVPRFEPGLSPPADGPVAAAPSLPSGRRPPRPGSLSPPAG